MLCIQTKFVLYNHYRHCASYIHTFNQDNTTIIHNPLRLQLFSLFTNNYNTICNAMKILGSGVSLFYVFTGYLPGAAAPGTDLDLRPVALLSRFVQPIGLVRR